jgi:protein-L-isoaspartate(D-aspartate) O-methyltransferase
MNTRLIPLLRFMIALLVLSLLGCAPGPSPDPPQPAPPQLDSAESAGVDVFAEPRSRMVARLAAQELLQDEAVTAAMLAVPRHRFVSDELVSYAYDDFPLPIGFGQTISAPSIVALMTELLELEPGDKVLEIGTGSGYQAAVLAELEDVEVYSIEIVPQLAELAADQLQRAGYDTLHLAEGDGYYGWPEHAPYDAIIVTAAPDHLPAPLVGQLNDGGRAVIPIGPPGSYQTLWKFVKQGEELIAYNITGVAFVPFTGPGIDRAPTE